MAILLKLLLESRKLAGVQCERDFIHAQRGATVDGAGPVYLFYVAIAPAPNRCALPVGYSGEFWRPALGRIMPVGMPPGERKQYLLRRMLHALHLYSHREYCVFVVRHGSQLVHYSGVRPKYWRFPFMSPVDIQIGDTWTDRQHRARGIARFALQEILKKFEAPGRQFWYVVADSNVSSIKVAEAAGMTAV